MDSVRRGQTAERRAALMHWAREAKPQLISNGAVDFDPNVEIQARGLVAQTVRAPDVREGFDRFAGRIGEVISRTLGDGGRALAAADTGIRPWPNVLKLSRAWYLGGSSAVPSVRDAIAGALLAYEAQAEVEPLAVPDQYAAWDPMRYRLMACALGASRPELLRPEDLPPRRGPLGSPLSDYDKDAG